jgi:hypothetical protein
MKSVGNAKSGKPEKVQQQEKRRPRSLPVKAELRS